MSKTQRLTTISTPSHADADNTIAQQLTVKKIVARLPPDRFHVTMFSGLQPDPRIKARPNTQLVPVRRRGNTVSSSSKRPVILTCAFDWPDAARRKRRAAP